MSVILTLLGIVFVLIILVIIAAFALLKKGARFLWKGGRHRYWHFSSSEYRHRGPFWKHGHKTYGHHHYHRRHSSRSGFFSS